MVCQRAELYLANCTLFGKNSHFVQLSGAKLAFSSFARILEDNGVIFETEMLLCSFVRGADF